MGYREYYNIFKKVKKALPYAKFTKLQFQEGPKGELQVRRWGADTWMDLYKGKNINSQLPNNVKRFLGSKNPNRKETDEEIMKTIRQEYPDADFNLIGLRYGPRDVIQLRYFGKTAQSNKGWYDLKKLDGKLNTKLNPRLPEVIRARLESANLGIKLENVESTMSRIALAEEAAAIEKDADMAPLRKEYEEALEEKNQLLIERDKYEAHLRQIDALAENYREEAVRLQDIILDSNRPEEERDDAAMELLSVREEIDKLETEIEETENRLGLTTKEKIMRMLKKYGIPAAVASMLAAIISVVVAVGTRIKQTGIALEKRAAELEKKGKERADALEKKADALEKKADALSSRADALSNRADELEKLGKEMEAQNPGLLDSVVALIERTAGRILKFVGNNIWILVVAVGLLILLKI